MLNSEWFRAENEGSKALLVALHGLGDSCAGYRWLPQMLDLPWLNYLLVNAPDPYYGGFSWYDFAGDPAPGVRRSRDLLFALLDSLKEQGHPADQTVLLGFSQGCLMTWEIGLRYPRRLAGCVGISGYVHEPEAAVKELSPVAGQQKFLVTHGTSDPMVPFEGAKAQVMMLKKAGLDIQWHEFQKGHTIAGEEEVRLIRTFICDRVGTPS